MPGTGLGLTIVRAIVEAHGGSIACRSDTGKGTTFTFTIPQPSLVDAAAPSAVATAG